MGAIREKIFHYLFSDLPPFKWINGHKTQIGQICAFVFGLIALIDQFWPGVVPVEQTTAMLGTILGLLGIEVGKIHKYDKTKKSDIV